MEYPLKLKKDYKSTSWFQNISRISINITSSNQGRIQRGLVGFSPPTLFWLKISFSCEILDKFDWDTVFTINIHTPYHLPYTFLKQVYFTNRDGKIAGWVANSVDPDQTPRFVASDLGLHGLLWPVFPKT